MENNNLDREVTQLTAEAAANTMAVMFAEWIGKNFWHYSNTHWHNGSFFKGWEFRTDEGGYEYKTTKELLNLYLNEDIGEALANSSKAPVVINDVPKDI